VAHSKAVGGNGEARQRGGKDEKEALGGTGVGRIGSLRGEQSTNINHVWGKKRRSASRVMKKRWGGSKTRRERCGQKKNRGLLPEGPKERLRGEGVFDGRIRC